MTHVHTKGASSISPTRLYTAWQNKTEKMGVQMEILDSRRVLPSDTCHLSVVAAKHISNPDFAGAILKEGGLLL